MATGKLDLDLSLAEVNHNLKIRAIGADGTTTLSNGFKIKSECIPLEVDQNIASYNGVIPASNAPASASLTSVEAGKTYINAFKTSSPTFCKPDKFEL